MAPNDGRVMAERAGNPSGSGALTEQTSWKRIGVVMERELTPVEARGGVISGRIIRILLISTAAAALALGLAWFVVFSRI
jgi:hypothetical protein